MATEQTAERDVDPPLLLPPGEYTATYAGHAGMFIFRTMKLRVDLRLLAHPGLVFARWYRVTNFRGGRISAPPHSDIVREVSAVLGQRIRPDRIPVSMLAEKYLRVIVTTVKTDRNQHELAAVNHYSRIERIEGRMQP